MSTLIRICVAFAAALSFAQAAVAEIAPRQASLSPLDVQILDIDRVNGVRASGTSLFTS